ncbi:hypothetical protein PEC331060_06980 [Pectobacterium carotovorum subsp. carotovorum]|nr:hypothetical protein PEC331060_06980 [Pectobacterium carotovorum subsp. carotovorum]
MWLITIFSVILMNTSAATDSDNRFTTGTFTFQQAAEDQINVLVFPLRFFPTSDRLRKRCVMKSTFLYGQRS